MFRFGRKNEASQEVSVSNREFSTLLAGSSVDYPALSNSAFWSCLTKLCTTYATLPLHLYRRTEEGSEVVREGRLFELLQSPNRYQTPYEFRWCLAFNYELLGKAFIILRRKQGLVYAMYPVSPHTMTMRIDDAGSRVWYCSNGETYADSDVIQLSHYPVGMFDKVLSPVDYAEDDVTISHANKMLQSSFFKRGTSVGATITVPKNTNQKVKDSIKAMMLSDYSGSNNAFKVLVLEDGVKFEPIKLDSADTNALVQAQGWTLQEVARRFGVPASWIGDMTKATYANSEQQGMDLVTYALQPRMTAWENYLQKLCPAGEYLKFNMNGLMRGDHAARSAFYHQMLMDGVMSPNEVRKLEDMNGIGPEGDKHFFPLNYGSLDQVGEGQTESVKGTDPLAEKKLQEKRFIAEVQAVTQSARRKIEKQIRAQLKVEIEYLRNLKDLTPEGIVEAFTAWCQSQEAAYGGEYRPVFQDIMNRLLPIVQRQVGSKSPVPQNSLDAFASSYADAMANRLVKSRIDAVDSKLKNASPDEVEDDIDDICDDWVTNASANESEEESHRAGNAFDVYLYGRLGVHYMHVVAQPDSCEFCHGIEGKPVEVDGIVLAKGMSVSDGEGNTRVIRKSYKHPPWHMHCKCMVVPGK